MTHRSRKAITLGILIALLLWVVPAHAHADFGISDLVSVGSIGAEAVLSLIREILQAVHKILLLIIAGIGEILQSVVNLKVSAGGKPVYTVWRILRDFCNMSFIIALILMAFGTIFDSFSISFLKAFSINSRGVISGFLIAAFMLNFSLAIGQVVVATSNQLSGIVLNVFPVNISASLAQAVDLSKTQLGSFKPTAPAVLDNVDVKGLPPGYQRAVGLVPPAAQTQFTECLQNNTDTSYNCYNRIILPALDAANARGQAATANQSVVSFSLSDNWRCLTGGSCAITEPSVGNWTMLRQIANTLWLIFLCVMLVLSLALVLVFMLVRIPALWVLLALSPLAWTSKAFPGTAGFSEWWKQFMAWNIFSPLYLFVMYLGILMAQKTGQMVHSLANADGTVPLITGFLGELFGYGMVAIVFIGGTAQALKMSFAGGSYAKSLVDKVSGGLGISGQYGAAAPASRFISRLTGAGAAADTIKATAVARGEKLAQTGRGIVQKSRFAQIVKPVTYEEKLAAAKAKMGVAGGAKAFADLKFGQVTAAQKTLGSELSGVPKAQQQSYLEGKMNAADKNVALAAREELLKRGLLSKTEVDKTRAMYGAAGSGAQRAFDDRVKRSAGASAKEKKEESKKEREEIMGGITVALENNKKLPPGQQKAPLQLVQDTLSQFTEPAEREAAIDALAEKYPDEVVRYLYSPAGGMSLNDAIDRAYEPLMKEPASIIKLPNEYFDKAGGSAQFLGLKNAVNNMYPPANANTPAGEARYKFMEDLIKKQPRKASQIRDLFS